ncbi:BCD family MFS transporter [Aerosakkonemataceae cyanobacterium BLCC-F50]|uniref:BCD family MFS transporter n=1 Tax=Floridaenema flaviceps BLCC-F50 TaxID=3153642 RepID=A0ABV4XPT4_9CYAN
MATGDFSKSDSLEPANPKVIPSVNLLTMFRLGLFQMGLGIMSVLALGILNQVMIADLGINAIVAAGAIAMHQFIAPVRLWFGQMSDAKPIFGYHRTSYVWIGAALFTFASFVAVQVMWQLGNAVKAAGGWSLTTQTVGWTALLALIFALYGLALSMSSTPFAALLVDVSEEDNRSKIVSIVWSMLMVGIIVGAILGGSLLNRVKSNAPLEILQSAINNLFIIVPVVVFGLAILATFGVEKKYSHYGVRSLLVDREDKITLGVAWRILTASRQTAIFFTFLLIMTISLFMQEAVLEPYGRQVFNMTISETTRNLNAFWGIGTLIGMSTTGFLVVPRIGKQKTTKVGCLAVAVCFILIILSGFTQNPKLLLFALFLFGLGSGVATTGAISLMLDLTAAETAGTFIGAWGLAQAIARASATFTGGVVLDLGKKLFTNLVLAYGLVFALQAVGMIVAVWFLRRVNVMEFRTNAKDAIASVLGNDLD